MMINKYERLDFVKETEKSIKKSKPTLNGSAATIRIKEVLLPQNFIEQLFDSSKRMGYETDEEKEHREKKEEYNKLIIEKIKTIKFTKKQSKILKLIYIEGKSLTEIAKMLRKTPQGIFRIRNEAIAKVRKYIKYDFK